MPSDASIKRKNSTRSFERHRFCCVRPPRRVQETASEFHGRGLLCCVLYGGSWYFQVAGKTKLKADADRSREFINYSRTWFEAHCVRDDGGYP